MSEAKDKVNQNFGKKILKELQLLCHWAKAPPDQDQWCEFYQRFIDLIFDHHQQKDEAVALARSLIRQIDSAKQPRHPSPPSLPLVEPLTNRELGVLDLLAQRLSNREIADELFISTITVKGHLQNIYGKLGVSKRREAVEKARKIGIL